MLTIKNIYYEMPELPSNECDVHGFYGDTIKKLYGVDVSLTAPRSPTRNHTLIVKLIKSAIKDNTDDIKRFYDIRLEEELGAAAPQYEILEALCLPKLLPLCIKGMGVSSIAEGLKLAEAQLDQNEAAIFAISRLRSVAWQSDDEEFALAFIAVKEE